MSKLVRPTTVTQYKELSRLITEAGNVANLAHQSGVARSTLQEWVNIGRTHGVEFQSRSQANIGAYEVQDVKQLKLKTELKEARTKNKELEEAAKEQASKLAEVEKHLSALKILEEHADAVAVPEWIRKRHSDKVTGVPQLMLSDLHWGEVVDPSQVNGVNEYNLAIAKVRMKKCINTTIELLKYKINGNYPGIVVSLAGDMFDGFALGHLELLINSDADILETFLALQVELASALVALADEFGHVFVPVVVGNHGRLHLKPQAKGAVKNNLDWLLAKQLEIQLAHDKRIQFHIPNSLDCFYQIYGRTTCLTHGDQFKGGSGIAGLWSAILLGHARKLKRQQALGRPFDVLQMGHWHQLTLGKGIIVNSSMVGYDEYAYKNNFAYEVPSQALFINHPTHDLTHWLPVYLEAKQQQSSDWVAWSK